MALLTLGFSGWPFHDAFHAASPTESAWEVTSRVPTRQLSARLLAAAGIAGAAAYTRAQGPELQ